MADERIIEIADEAFGAGLAIVDRTGLGTDRPAQGA